MIEGITLPANAAAAKPADTAVSPAGSALTASVNLPPGATYRTSTTVTVAGGAKPAAAAKPNPTTKPKLVDVLDADTAQVEADGRPRMRRVALPGIVAGRVYDWDVAGGGPIGRIAIALGLAGNGSTALAITLKQLVTLELDQIRALQALDDHKVEWLRAHRLTPVRLLWLTQRSNPDPVLRICGGKEPDRARRATIHVVTRVMYTHEIHYEYGGNSNIAGRLAADISQVSTSNPARPLVPAAASSSGSGAASATAATEGRDGGRGGEPARGSASRAGNCHAVITRCTHQYWCGHVWQRIVAGHLRAAHGGGL